LYTTGCTSFINGSGSNCANAARVIVNAMMAQAVRNIVRRMMFSFPREVLFQQQVSVIQE
jgi:hypothetical protein